MFLYSRGRLRTTEGVLMDNFLFAAFPYIAFALAIFGGIYRYFRDRFSYSSISSQLLENRLLFWGSIPWHYGIILVLLDYSHLTGGLFPNVWASLVKGPTAVFVTELIGTALGFFALFGIIVLIIRRFATPKLLGVTSTMDWILLVVLTLQVASGLSVAIFYRWGSLWFLDTAVPWFWSISSLRPSFTTIANLPWLVKFHMANAFLVIALFPFTRLVHIFTVPITYLWRPYQVAIWNRKRMAPADAVQTGVTAEPRLDPAEIARRQFLKIMTGAMALAAVVVLIIPLIGTIIGPSFRSRKGAWAKVGDVASLPVGQPVSLKFPFKAEDAYIRETVTRDVWVIKHSSNSLTVFSPICPHLGCHYSWNPQAKKFMCPCHGSIYSMTGQVLGGPAPRPLDTLPIKIENGELYIEWEMFKVGIPEKVAI